MVLVLTDAITKDDVDRARQEYQDYIKVTIDIVRGVVAIGGEYHADAEKVLLENYNCKSEDVFGGGYNILTKEIEFTAMINIRPKLGNNSMEILDQEIRNKFKEIAERSLMGIESFI